MTIPKILLKLYLQKLAEQYFYESDDSQKQQLLENAKTILQLDSLDSSDKPVVLWSGPGGDYAKRHPDLGVSNHSVPILGELFETWEEDFIKKQLQQPFKKPDNIADILNQAIDLQQEIKKPQQVPQSEMLKKQLYFSYLLSQILGQKLAFDEYKKGVYIAQFLSALFLHLADPQKEKQVIALIGGGVSSVSVLWSLEARIVGGRKIDFYKVANGNIELVEPVFLRLKLSSEKLFLQHLIAEARFPVKPFFDGYDPEKLNQDEKKNLKEYEKQKQKTELSPIVYQPKNVLQKLVSQKTDVKDSQEIRIDSDSPQPLCSLFDFSCLTSLFCCER